MRGTAVPRTWATLPARFLLASRVLDPRFGGILATDSSAQAAAPCFSLHFAGLISTQSRAHGGRCSTHSQAIRTGVPRSSTNSQATHLRAFPRNNTMTITSRNSAQCHEVANRCSTLECRLTVSYLNRINKSFCTILSDISKKIF